MTIKEMIEQIDSEILELREMNAGEFSIFKAIQLRNNLEFAMKNPESEILKTIKKIKVF